MAKGTLTAKLKPPSKEPETPRSTASAPAAGAKGVNLQDVFLNHLRREKLPVTMFLVNGVMLQGRIAAYDLFCMLLEREGFVQLAYKHAVSTIQPAAPVDLTNDWDEEEGEPA